VDAKYAWDEYYKGQHVQQRLNRGLQEIKEYGYYEGQQLPLKIEYGENIHRLVLGKKRQR